MSFECYPSFVLFSFFLWLVVELSLSFILFTYINSLIVLFVMHIQSLLKLSGINISLLFIYLSSYSSYFFFLIISPFIFFLFFSLILCIIIIIYMLFFCVSSSIFLFRFHCSDSLNCFFRTFFNIIFAFFFCLLLFRVYLLPLSLLLNQISSELYITDKSARLYKTFFLCTLRDTEVVKSHAAEIYKSIKILLCKLRCEDIIVSIVACRLQ